MTQGSPRDVPDAPGVIRICQHRWMGVCLDVCLQVHAYRDPYGLCVGIECECRETAFCGLAVAFISELWTTERTVSSEVIKTSFSLLCNCFPKSLSQLLLNKIDAFSPLFDPRNELIVESFYEAK